MDAIIRSFGGSAIRVVKIKEVQIPDLWHIAMWLKGVSEGRMTLGPTDTEKPFRSVEQLSQDASDVLECWGLCHDLLDNLCTEDEG